MKKALVTRPGAFGDMIIISPLFRILKGLGYHVICHTGKRGLQVLKKNPFIDEFIEYSGEGDEKANYTLISKNLENKIQPDWFKDFAESLEVNVSSHPRSAAYNYPKNEQPKRLHQNFYDAAMDWAGFPDKHGLRGDLFFDNKEEKDVHKYLRKGKFNIVWGLAGSGQNKAYPWGDYVIGELLKNHPNVHILTVGDEKCQILEYNSSHKNLTRLSGKTTWRESMLLTKYADLVVSPDTGLLHAAGCFATAKIGILGHTTIENITKYFENDFSLEPIPAECECAPCHKLIYDNKIQCPVDNLNGASWCMSKAQPPLRLYYEIMRVMTWAKSK